MIPRGLAKPATEESLKWLEAQKKIEEEKAEQALKQAQDFASRLDGLEVVIPVKVGDEGQMFESVSVHKVVEKLKEAGFEIKKSQVLLPESIKEIGEHPVRIRLEHNLEPEIKVIVAEEK